MRRMSFAATTSQMWNETKTETMRKQGTWHFLGEHEIVLAIEKGQGLKKGQKQIPIRPIEILSRETVPLLPLSAENLAAEGFPNLTADEFISQVWEPIRGEVSGSTKVERIKFKHRPDIWTPGFLPSNGTDGDIFRDRFCNHCEHDHNEHGPMGDGYDPAASCQIYMYALLAERVGPPEWQRRAIKVEGEPWPKLERRCSEFESCGPCDDVKAEAEFARRGLGPTNPLPAKSTPVVIDGQGALAI